MRILLLSFVLFCFDLLPAFAQHEADNWYFGVQSGLSFQKDLSVIESFGKLNARESCAAISDKKTGALLFYSDGVTIWNRKHEVMNNGVGLRGGNSSTQGVLIVPDPGNSLQYYVLTTSEYESGDDALYYSLVSLVDPDGEVISKNNLLLKGISEKLTGTIDCLGSGYWIVTHHRFENKFYSFRITKSGLNTNPVISTDTTEIKDFLGGYIKISPDNTKLALASFPDFNASKPISYLALYDFDASTGIVSNFSKLKQADIPSYFYGVAFSPDNSKLYATHNAGFANYIYQYELHPQNGQSVVSTETTFNTSAGVGALQIAPNGKIYSTHEQTGTLGVINNPNAKGTACNYIPNGVKLVGKSKLGLPNFMDFFFHQGGTPQQTFTLQPETITILPGKEFTSILNIQGSLSDWSVKLHYNPLVVKFKSISEGLAIPDNLKGELSIKGSGGNKSISIYFDAFLPHTSDTVFPIQIEIDASQVTDCGKAGGIGNILMLEDYCARNIRMVSSTGKKYYLTVKDKSIDFGVGLSGNVRMEVFDYVGKSVLVVSDGNLEAGEYSTALDLPVGVYYCRMSAGMYQSVGKVMIVR